MESKHKNVLIGALLAVVFVMAVGYAAFATTLTINGEATITSNWHVGFDMEKDEDVPGVVTATKKNTVKVNLKLPVCASPGDRIALSRRVGARWRLIGYGIIV